MGQQARKEPLNLQHRDIGTSKPDESCVLISELKRTDLPFYATLNTMAEQLALVVREVERLVTAPYVPSLQVS